MKNRNNVNNKIIYTLILISLLPILTIGILKIINIFNFHKIRNNSIKADQLILQILQDNNNSDNLILDKIKETNDSMKNIRNVLVLSRPDNKLLFNFKKHNNNLINPYVKLINEMSINKEYCKTKYGIFYKLFYNKTFYEPDFYYLSDHCIGDEIIEANNGKIGTKIRHNYYYTKSFLHVKSLYYVAIPHFLKGEKIIILIESEFFDNQKIILIMYFSIFLSIIFSIISLPILFICITKPLKTINKELTKTRINENYFITTEISYRNKNNEFGDISRAYKMLSEITNNKISEIEKYSRELSVQFSNPVKNIKQQIEELNSNNIIESKKEEILKSIIENANKMNSIITKLRKITKIRNKNDNETSEFIPIDLFINNFINRFKQNKNYNISFFGKCKNKKIYIPITHFELILTELLMNGLEYNNEIIIKSNIIKNHVNKLLQISIEDSGSGISPENTKFIFNNFYTNWNNNNDHLGFGLPLVKAIVNSHNGFITVSRGNKLGGANFLVKLPLEKIK